ncbi:MAG: DUF502 domain-containing protein [Phycisphaerales bacterium]|nr:DUF502 domain-containing protein [Phycisphaerales bacterium]
MSGLLRRIAAIFTQGLVGLLPLIVTVVVLGWLASVAERVLGTAIQYVIPDNWYIRGMGLAAGVIVVFIFGLLINVYGVPQLINITERRIGRVPLVKTIYGAVRDLLSFFTRKGEEGGVNQVVVVTFGDSGIKAVGLLMRDTYEGLPEGLGGDDYIVVYFPQSYQLGGMLLLVPRENVTPLDMKLEDALRFIITAGAKTTTSKTAPPARVDEEPAGPPTKERFQDSDTQPSASEY